MDKKARTPIVEHEDSFAIELPGGGAPRERDTLDDQGMVVAYDRLPGATRRWRLRALYFDREQWTRSGIRRWWAAHEVQFLAEGQLNIAIPEICRIYPAPEPSLPTIVLCHRNTPLVAARKQIEDLKRKEKGPGHVAGQ
jgi:hypothetical protein